MIVRRSGAVGARVRASACWPPCPAVCGESTIVTLVADEVVPVGSVEVVQDESSLYVVYRTEVGWPIHKTALFAGVDGARTFPCPDRATPESGGSPT